jgi:hypothetical protein
VMQTHGTTRQAPVGGDGFGSLSEDRSHYIDHHHQGNHHGVVVDHQRDFHQTRHSGTANDVDFRNTVVAPPRMAVDPTVVPVYLNLDSRHRDYVTYPGSSEFRTTLSKYKLGVQNIALIDAQIPSSAYNVENKINSRITARVSGRNAVLSGTLDAGTKGFDSVSVDDGGERYIFPVAEARDRTGKGSGATFDVVFAGGIVTAVTVATPGSGYSTKTIVEIKDLGGFIECKVAPGNYTTGTLYTALENCLNTAFDERLSLVEPLNAGITAAYTDGGATGFTFTQEAITESTTVSFTAKAPPDAVNVDYPFELFPRTGATEVADALGTIKWVDLTNNIDDTCILDLGFAPEKVYQGETTYTSPNPMGFDVPTYIMMEIRLNNRRLDNFTALGDQQDYELFAKIPLDGGQGATSYVGELGKNFEFVEPMNKVNVVEVKIYYPPLKFTGTLVPYNFRGAQWSALLKLMTIDGRHGE